MIIKSNDKGLYYTCDIDQYIYNNQIEVKEYKLPVYICHHSREYIAIRTIGQTIGYIAIDKNFIINEIRIYDTSFVKFNNTKELEQFLGQKIENYNILLEERTL